jgi:hypothetical protein
LVRKSSFTSIDNNNSLYRIETKFQLKNLFRVLQTAVIEDNVSILHSVTLGGTGTQQGDRHPKIRTGVLIGAGAHLIGDIEIGA